MQYLLLGVLALMSSCQDPEYVLPTAERQGITSLTALLHQVLRGQRSCCLYNCGCVYR
ncbi:DUF5018 domain-containing protein [Bacteroides thetaiotaomicron]|nr:DUF5018 domain-containing protein [Bacteroides thetaiotaomicron]